MSAIQMTCTRCNGRFIAGMVGRTPWPQHVCPDGTTGAAASFGWRESITPITWTANPAGSPKVTDA